MGRLLCVLSASFRVSFGAQRAAALRRPVRPCRLSCAWVASGVDRNGEPPHKPVLLREIVEKFDGRQLQTFVDCTLGAGGHSAAILQEHREVTLFLGMDLDNSALEIASEKLQQLAVGTPTQVRLVNANFRDLDQALLDNGLPECDSVDGMIMDLGMSSMQVDDPDRGFSFLGDGALDMRMDTRATLSAEEIVNTWSEADLGRIFREFGEEKMWRKVAQRICDAREEAPISTTKQLVEAIGNTVFRAQKRQKKIHPATRVFQALRIAVNGELESLVQALPKAIQALAPGGRLGVISFHSLEDRLVKHAFMRAAGRVPIEQAVLDKVAATKAQAIGSLRPPGGLQPVARILTKKPISASDDEQQSNPRSRSAKLRFLEKL